MEEDDDNFGEEDVRDPLNRGMGRVPVAPADQPPIPGGTRAGYEYQPPKHGVELMGWRIKATFPTGPRNELRWHDGFVFGCTSMEREEGGTVEQYTIFFPIDMGCITAHAPFNDKSICFRKQNLPDPKVSEREMARARAAQAQGEAQDEE